MGADLGAVTWHRGGVWQAFLLFCRARAQKAEHVVWALLPWLPRLNGCGCSDRRFGAAGRRSRLLDVTLVLFIS